MMIRIMQDNARLRGVKKKMGKAATWWQKNFLIVLSILKACVSLASAQTTEFVPDEYWQSTEVAFYKLFGEGHLTWEWVAGIRSYIFPGIIYGIYSIELALGIKPGPLFMTLAPQLVQLTLTVYGEWCFYKFAVSRIGERTGKLATFLMLVNWFTTFCGARLISNQTEMSINCICLYLLQQGRFKSMVLFFIWLPINFMIRPTTAVFWLPFIPETLRKLGRLRVKDAFYCGFMCGVTIWLGTVLDVVMYGKPVITWWEFCKFNFLTSGASEFGDHHLLWYLYSALPSIFLHLVIFLPYGFYCEGCRAFSVFSSFYLVVFRLQPRVMLTILFDILTYSLIGHKEIRFLLPVMPLLCMVLAVVLVRVTRKLQEWNVHPEYEALKLKLTTAFFVLLVAMNGTVAVYFGVFHQRGVKPAANFIVHEIEKMDTNITPSVWIMMPCYAVPVHAYLYHPLVHYEYYVCAPNQYQHLYKKPKHGQLFQPNGFSSVDVIRDMRALLHRTKPPDFIMVFDFSLSKVRRALKQAGFAYRECNKFRHSIIKGFPKYLKSNVPGVQVISYCEVKADVLV